GRQDGTVSAGNSIAVVGATATLPFYLVPNKFNVGDDVIWTSGAHSVRFGANVMRMRENTWAPFQVGGVWTFSSLQNFLPGVPATPSGQVSHQQFPAADATKDYRYTLFTPYFDDQWKLSSRLTLNLGFRYSPTTKIGNVRHEMLDLVNAPFG